MADQITEQNVAKLLADLTRLADDITAILPPSTHTSLILMFVHMLIAAISSFGVVLPPHKTL